MTKIIIKSALLALIVTLVSARPALAGYIDPNTGGLLFQMLAVGFAFFSGIMLVFSRQIRMALARARRFLLTRSSIGDAGMVVKRWFSSISKTSWSNWMAWTAIPPGLAWRMGGTC